MSTYKTLDSSNIKAIDYDNITDKLRIFFVSGYAYDFFGVKQNVVDALLKAPSAGTYFHKAIKDAYPYQRVRAKVPSSPT